MNWIRIFVFALFTLCVTGSVSYVCMNFCIHMFRVENPYTMLAMQKIAVVMFAVPFVFAVVFFKYAGGMLKRTPTVSGVFWIDPLEKDDWICTALAFVWLCGFAAELLGTFRAGRRLDSMRRGSRPIVNGRRRVLFEQYRARFGLSRAELFENPGLCSPVCVKCGCERIILPDASYSDKELHMIFSHEMNHLKYKDLWWRRMVLIGSMINWYHPWQRALERRFIEQQEIVCDLRASVDNPAFSQKEYGAFLAGLSGHAYGNLPVTAFQESGNLTVRRLRAMSRARGMGKPGSLRLAAWCAGLLAAGLLPAAVVLAQVIVWEEGRIYAAESGTKLEPSDIESSGEVHTIYENDAPAVTEVDLTEEEEPAGKMLDTRLVFRNRRMTCGSKVTLFIASEDERAVFRVGIKNMDTGETEYVEAGIVCHEIFSITESGNYAAFVENRGNQPIRISGLVCYEMKKADGGTERAVYSVSDG